MPHLRLQSPALSAELKRKLAFQLTDAVIAGLCMDDSCRQRTTIRFDAVNAEDLAVAGELLSEGGAPDYLLEITDLALSDAQKHAAVKAIVPVLMQNFGLRKEQAWKINIRFHCYQASDYAVGGTFLDEVEVGNPFRLRARAMQINTPSATRAS